MQHKGNSAKVSRVVIGCVAENEPKYLSQALRLVQSIRWFGGTLNDADIIVCVVEEIDPCYRDEFAKYSAAVKIVSRFSTKHTQSNKLRFLELKEIRAYDHIALFDCDTIVVQDPDIYFIKDGLQAKIADSPTVPHAIFEKLFAFFDLPIPEKIYECTVDGEATIPYFNAGILIFSRTALADLVPKWIEINKRLIERIDLLGDCSNYCEQASLSLALVASNTPFNILGNEMNFPMHFETPISHLESVDPLIVHYHWLVEPSGYIKQTHYDRVNIRLRQFNERLREEREKNFDNRMFWNLRYAENPDLGSGIGSRGEAKDYKRTLLRDLWTSIRPATILDVGCGDMEISNVLSEEGYIGIDISDVIIRKNQERYPNRTFISGDFIKMDLSPADMVLCLDLLIHINDFNLYKKILSQLISKAKKIGIVAGYEVEPAMEHGVTFYHEPLSETLRRCGARDIEKMGAYRNVTVLTFKPASTGNEHPRYKKDRASYCQPRKTVFLVGTMRSGTTLLAELLSKINGITHCPFELKDVWSKEGGVPMASSKTRDTICPELNAHDVREGQCEKLNAAFVRRMIVTGCKKPEEAIFLNKNPHLCNKLPFVDALFPEACFIWIYRHLPSVVASLKYLFEGVRTRKHTWHYWPEPDFHTLNRCWNTFHFHLPEDIDVSRCFPDGNVRYLAEYWFESNRAISNFFRNITEDRRIVLQEEHLIKYSAEQLARCCDFLNLPPPAITRIGQAFDNTRNELWIQRLSLREIGVLLEFVEEHEKAIDDIFLDNGYAIKTKREIENCITSKMNAHELAE